MTTERRVWHNVRALVLEQYDARPRAVAELGMSFIKIKALMKLVGGPLTMRELSTSLGTDRPYTTVVVDDLEQRGLVERTVHPDDRRSKIVSLTAAGAQQSETAGWILDEPPPALEKLSPADLAALDRIARALRAD